MTTKTNTLAVLRFDVILLIECLYRMQYNYQQINMFDLYSNHPKVVCEMPAVHIADANTSYIMMYP